MKAIWHFLKTILRYAFMPILMYPIYLITFIVSVFEEFWDGVVVFGVVILILSIILSVGYEKHWGWIVFAAYVIYFIGLKLYQDFENDIEQEMISREWERKRKERDAELDEYYKARRKKLSDK